MAESLLYFDQFWLQRIILTQAMVLVWSGLKLLVQQKYLQALTKKKIMRNKPLIDLLCII
jgi:hypothetical protein